MILLGVPFSDFADGDGGTPPCDTGSVALVTGTSPDYPCGSSLSRIGRNVLRIFFDAPITTPLQGEVEIRELLADGQFGEMDYFDRFDFSIENDTVLKIVEDGCRDGTCESGARNPTCMDGPDVGKPCGRVLTNTLSYTFFNHGAWCAAEPFEVSYSVVYGDANNSGDTSLVDLVAISAYASMPDSPEHSRDDSPFDINTFGGISFIDISAANDFFASVAQVYAGSRCFPFDECECGSFCGEYSCVDKDGDGDCECMD